VIVAKDIKKICLMKSMTRKKFESGEKKILKPNEKGSRAV
jgi:hypothetical protein